MKNHFYPLFVFSLLILSSICCKKNDPTKNATLPAATQEGKNTIGFTINGEVWIPYAKCGAFGDPCREISARYGEAGGASANGIDFGFTRIRNDKMSYLSVSSFFATITTIGEKIDSIGVTYRAENTSGNDGHFTGPLNGSKFYINKIDFAPQIIAGQFELILLEQNGNGNKLILKDGRFDFTFNACKCNN